MPAHPDASSIAPLNRAPGELRAWLAEEKLDSLKPLIGSLKT
jgi:hypothetical protein